MKNIIIFILVLIGLYWLFDHFAPLPLNHESLGLYNHGIHRIIGVVFLVVAAIFVWKWNFKKQ
jgi:hypothetical protein